jgi:23S rRNA (pseudouridine1915-N3)-methyltransferase
MAFVIGGAEGLPRELKEGNKPLLSLSKMTWPHQMARMLLAEQIYRASEIRKGSGYHKA